MFSNLWWMWRDGISEKVCKAILDDIDWDESKTAAFFDTLTKKPTVNPEKRVTDVVWRGGLHISSIISGAHINTANSEAGWNFELFSLEKVQISRYKQKGHYDWHRDDISEETGVYRKLTLVVLLNDPSEYEGGKLEIQDFNGELLNLDDFKCGSVIVFPSCLKHRVTPVTSGTRYSAVSWASGPQFK